MNRRAGDLDIAVNAVFASQIESPLLIGPNFVPH
jgi:hypothetical protein